MDPFNSTDDQAELPDHTSNEEAASNTVILTRGMKRDVFDAAKEGNIDVLRAHKEHLDQIMTATKNSILHIHIACSSDQTIVKEILEICPALLMQQNENGDTALHFAARHGPDHAVGLLIEAAKALHQDDLERGPASLEEVCLPWQMLMRTTNNKKDTALHEAVRFDQFNAVKLLLADPEFRYSPNDAGETPLYLAAERGFESTFSQILRSCKYPVYVGPNGRTALHAAVINNDEEITRALLERDGNLTKAVDEEGSTPLHLAASLGHISMVKILVEYDRCSAYAARKDDKMTPLHSAVSKGHLDVVKELISHCPDTCELIDFRCQNVLHYAFQYQEYGIVNFLISDVWRRTILLNGKDVDGNTPLHHFVDRPLWNTLNFLHDNRLDTMAFNKRNLNAIDIIVNEDKIRHSLIKDDVKKILESKGVRRGNRIKSHQGGANYKVEKTQDSEGSGDRVKEAKETHLVVATLIATVTFAAGITMPGGYSDEGSAILTRNAAFKIFVITNTIAMAMSSCSVLVLLYSSIHTKPSHKNQVSITFHIVVSLTMFSLMLMVVAFITGTYAVLGGNSSGLAISACVLACYSFFVIAQSLLSLEGEILKAPYFLTDIFRGFWWLSARSVLRALRFVKYILNYLWDD